jgi:hypothetical protein
MVATAEPVATELDAPVSARKVIEKDCRVIVDAGADAAALAGQVLAILERR